jgi:hypothetical protein
MELYFLCDPFQDVISMTVESQQLEQWVSYETHQEVTGEDMADWEDFMHAVITVIFGIWNSVRLL